MSAGVLTLKHSSEHRLAIAQTEDAVWETGEWTGLSDEDLYGRIRMVMHSYHDARKKREYVAPQLAAYIPLLPACDPCLLGLPEGIGVELIDLPGLKSVQDRTNLATIQKQVNKAFSLVTLDYGQVDDEHRRRLLEELKKVVEYLQGRTDSMIFILNRVDQRGTDDLPLALRIDTLKEEIKEVLSLPELPDIIPFNARLLYYAQCAWGSGALNESSKVEQQTRLEFIKKMFHDCSGTLMQQTENNWDLDDWFRDIRKQALQDNPVNDETMRQILRHVLEWSGGKQLWDCFRKRVQESFSDLVISPALVEVLNNYDVLATKLNILIQTRKIDTQEKIEQERRLIVKLRQSLDDDIEEINKAFKTKTEQIFDICKRNKPNQAFELNLSLEQEGKIFPLFFSCIDGIEKDLIKSLVVPVRDSFINNQSAFELRDRLQESIAPSLADDIAKSYDNVSRRLSTFSKEPENLVKRVQAGDNKAKKELEHDERHVRLLYHNMKLAMSTRAEFVLQTKAQQFGQALESLVDEEIAELKICLISENISLIDIQEAAISELHKELAQNLPTLPKNFLEVSDTIKQTRSKKNEVVGTETEHETYTEYYKEGSCLKTKKTRTKTRPVTRNITKDIEYIELCLPSPNLMAQQWSNGIDKQKERLWDVFLEWVLMRLDYAKTIFEESVKETTNLAERALQQQLSAFEANFEEQQQFWHNFKIQKDGITIVYQKLKEDF